MFFETSAKNGSNVNELFTEVIEKILEETEEPEEQPIEGMWMDCLTKTVSHFLSFFFFVRAQTQS